MARRAFQVIWAQSATRDLEEIVTYIAADSRANAEKALARLKHKAENLTASPLRGRVVPEMAEFGLQSWREIVVRPYRIISRIDEGRVFVNAVLDGRRDLQDILMRRLLR